MVVYPSQPASEEMMAALVEPLLSIKAWSAVMSKNYLILLTFSGCKAKYFEGWIISSIIGGSRIRSCDKDPS